VADGTDDDLASAGLLPMTRPQLKLKNGQAKGEQA
jgi:hypothetical protein